MNDNSVKNDWINELINSIDDYSAIIGIVGLGYVGLPLAVAFSNKFNVIGYNKNEERVKQLKMGQSYIEDVLDEEINLDRFTPTFNHEDLSACDFIIIAVPTPLREDKTPDLSYIIKSAEEVGSILKKGQFIILKSTTFPGTTEDYLIPTLEDKSGLNAIKDFGVAYSPERVDPGNKKFSIENTPNVIGGLIPEFTIIGSKLYSKVTQEVVEVKDCKTAEAVKMVENIFRNVNIALVNELTLIFEKMGINMWDVIDSAKTKPYGYMAFYPGPGVGGHCIPLDPYYLSYRAKHFGVIPRFIETAGEINDYMPLHTVNLAKQGLENIGKKIRDSNILILGLAYKENIGDYRESPAIKVIEELKQLFISFKVYDPHVNSIKTKFGTFYSEEDFDEALNWSDCIIIVTGHDIFKNNEKLIDIVKNKEKIVVDTRNVLKKDKLEDYHNYIKL